MQKPKKERVNYSDEFKKDAVARCKIVGATKTCDELGIVHSVLQRWRKQFPDEMVGTNPSKPNRPSYEELEKENKKLKKEMEYIESINSVLKKSTAIFSNSYLGSFK